MNIRGKILDLSTPEVMGILNVTPDSFYDGGRFTDEASWLDQVGKMTRDGAAIIDIGTVSTRPGASVVTLEEETERLIPVLVSVRKNFPEIILSVDTWRSGVAQTAMEHGADMINDISAGTYDEKMFATAARYKAPLILMHIQGRPNNMQDNPVYTDVVRDISVFLGARAEKAIGSGVPAVIIDPGFGFGKTLKHNYILLNHLSTFKSMGYPVMAGVSRKSMINKVLGTGPGNSLNGTTVANTIALMNGADILRVHDVKEAVETVKIYMQLRDA